MTWGILSPSSPSQALDSVKFILLCAATLRSTSTSFCDTESTNLSVCHGFFRLMNFIFLPQWTYFFNCSLVVRFPLKMERKMKKKLAKMPTLAFGA